MREKIQRNTWILNTEPEKPDGETDKIGATSNEIKIENRL